VKESLIILRMKIDRLSIRERIILLVMSLLVIFLSWSYLLYFPQQRWIVDMNSLTQREKEQAEALKRRQELVQNLKADTSIMKLMQKFTQLQAESREFDKQQARYSHRYIGEQELAKLLYSMLEKTGTVTIEHFATVDYTSGVPAKGIQEDGQVATVPAATTPAPVGAPPLPVQRVQYNLTLKGDYFSIMEYLRRLEQLKWELYWDKMDYRVQDYPQGEATIQFYTLKPTSEVPPPVPTSTPP
jgi:MSHA biogenesis protein MshJ